MIKNEVCEYSLAKLTIEQSFGKNSEATMFITEKVLSIFNSTNSTVAMLRAAYALSEIKDNPEKAKMCSWCLSNIAKNTKLAVEVILATEQLVKNKYNPSAMVLFSAMLRKTG